MKFRAIETVKTLTFLNFYDKQLNKSTIDLLKIDIEGHELEAFAGFGRSLNFIRVIQFEFGGCNIDTRTFFKDFWYFFKKNKFDIYRVSPFGPMRLERYSENYECFRTSNYLCVNLRYK